MTPLVEKYKPLRVADFAGLDRPKAIMQSLVASPYASAWLFLGSAGVGKTTMALAVAEEIGGEVHHIPSRQCDLEAVDKVCGACHYYPWHGDWHFVLVDEADQMTTAAQLAFLSKLDTTEAPPNTIFLFTANDTAKLAERFLSRVRVVRFETEDLAAPAAKLLADIWSAELPGADVPDLAKLVMAAKSNVRAAIMEMEMEVVLRRGIAARSVEPVKRAAAVAVSVVPVVEEKLTAAQHNARAAALRAAAKSTPLVQGRTWHMVAR
jgi:replication-associated recombination protein RarA